MVMIKIFNENDRDFSSNGNIVINPIKCKERKKRSLNGWYLTVEVDIKYKDYILQDKLCVVKTKSKLNPQAFRINNPEIINNRISFTANHVMFDAENYHLFDVRPTNQNGLEALTYINSRTDEVSPFTVYSNIENISTAYFIRKNLLEAWETIEERWGGTFDADNWNISLLSKVGNDNGETIAYKKNMQGIRIFEDWSSVCTKICPVGYDGLLLPEKYLKSDIQYEIPYTRTIDFQTELEEEQKTEENLINELRENARKYLEENKYPKISYEVTSNINQNMEIGDIIQVKHPLVTIQTEVQEYEHNILTNKIEELVFGNYTRDVKSKFDNVKKNINNLVQQLSKQESVIQKQTDLINSLNKKGFVYIDDNEVLILDAIPKEKAKNVWRFGLGGIGFSSNGYEGPFEIAMTMDGQINANFITTGVMSVERIEGLANTLSENERILAAINLSIDGIESNISKSEKRIEDIENNAIISVKIFYASSESQSEAPKEGWSEQAPTWKQGEYIWQKTVTTYANKETLESSPICISGKNGIDGKDGVGILKITPQYYLSNSNERQSGGDWKETQDPWKKDYYFWTRSKIEWTDNTTTYTTATLETGINELNEKIEQNAELISETSANLNIRIDEVETNVAESTTASILTLLNNGYLTAEQVNALVNGNAEDIATVKEQLKQTVTSSQLQIEITKAIEGGVSYLKNTLFTIDENGMAIATNQDEFNALYNNKGMYLYSFDELIARYDKDGAYFTNLKMTGEFETKNLRMMDVLANKEDRVHIHWIGA